MLKIISPEQFKSEIQINNTVCVVFSIKSSPVCTSMEYVLKDVCETLKYKLLRLEVDYNKFYSILEYYKIGPLPCCVLIKDGELIYKKIGIESKDRIKKEMECMEV